MAGEGASPVIPGPCRATSAYRQAGAELEREQRIGIRMEVEDVVGFQRSPDRLGADGLHCGVPRARLANIGSVRTDWDYEA
jgi:hypothetical protein